MLSAALNAVEVKMAIESMERFYFAKQQSIVILSCQTKDPMEVVERGKYCISDMCSDKR
jgi:hypothetical protein